MKKVISICFVFLLLFNALGFYGLFIGMRYKTKFDLLQRLDNELYSESETLTIKVPLAIPYHVDAEDYQRVDGEIEHNGSFFRLVKQKVARDTLFIVCIKDHQTKRIKQALTDYVKTFTDNPANGKQDGSNSISVIKNYLPTSLNISSISSGWCYTVFSTSPSYLSDSISIAVFSPPPQA